MRCPIEIFVIEKIDTEELSSTHKIAIHSADKIRYRGMKPDKECYLEESQRKWQRLRRPVPVPNLMPTGPSWPLRSILLWMDATEEYLSEASNPTPWCYSDAYGRFIVYYFKIIIRNAFLDCIMTFLGEMLILSSSCQ